MGMIMTEAQRPAVGEYHYRRAPGFHRRGDPILLANLAWNLKNQGRMAEARALYEEFGRADPDILPDALGWARLEETDRNFARPANCSTPPSSAARTIPASVLKRAVLLGRERAP